MDKKGDVQNLIIDMSKIKDAVEKKLHTGRIVDKTKNIFKNYIKTGVQGFDELFEEGIPKGANVLVVGGAGSGKTIFSLQLLNYHASKGKKCLFMSFEETEDKLIEHMEDFGWNPRELIKSGNLKIKRFLTSDIYYDDEVDDDKIQVMINKESDSLIMDLEPLTIVDSDNFKPDFVVLDSLTSISSTFIGKEQSYRFYIERLFRFFEGMGSTNFLITESIINPEFFTQGKVEEFLADGVIALYSIRRDNIRESAIEVLKMRGSKHQKKIVAMQITNNGIIVYPEQEIFGGIDGK